MSPPAPEPSSNVVSDTSSVKIPQIDSLSSKPTPGRLRKYDNLGSEYKLTKYNEDFEPLPRLKDLGDGGLEKLPELERIKSLKGLNQVSPLKRLNNFKEKGLRELKTPSKLEKKNLGKDNLNELLGDGKDSVNGLPGVNNLKSFELENNNKYESSENEENINSTNENQNEKENQKKIFLDEEYELNNRYESENNNENIHSIIGKDINTVQKYK